MPPNLTKVNFGLGWESRCDIDASILLLDATGTRLAAINWEQLQNANYPGVIHTGDN